MKPPLPFNQDHQARLAYLARLADRQTLDAERFDLMRLAAERYRLDPSPANAVKAHRAARRYIEATAGPAHLAPLDGDRP